MAEFENKNSYRNFPLAGDDVILGSDGVSFPTDVLVDAVIYEVNVFEPVSLLSIDFASGKVLAGTESGVSYSGTISNGVAEMYSNGKHSGTIVLGPGAAREARSGRRWSFPSARFSSACVVPVMLDCVTSVKSSGKTVDGRLIAVKGSGRLRTAISSETVDVSHFNTFRFDVTRLPQTPSQEDERPKLKCLEVKVLGESVFSVSRVDDTSVLVTSTSLSREDVCYQAHREDEVSKVHDTCSDPYYLVCNPGSLPHSDYSFTICGCSVSLQSFDLVNHRNPVKISTIGGYFDPNVPKIDAVANLTSAREEIEKLVLSPLGYGNGIKIEIPGAGE